MNKIQLSAVIITYNEEKNIARCIDSLLGVADEIVVLDSFSTDKTPEICKSYPVVKFYQHEFLGYIEYKNLAITHASYPYVLSLDADESIGEVLKKSILKIKNNWEKSGYTMNRLTNYCGKWIKHCGWYPDKKLRLFDSRLGCWTGKNPHDTYKFNKTPDVNTPSNNILNSNNDLDDRDIVAHLEGDILHYSYYTIHQHIAQVNKFTEISSQVEFNNEKKTNILGILFRSFWKFIRDYFVKLGFLDGYYGFIVCAISSFATFTKYIKLKELNKKNI